MTCPQPKACLRCGAPLRGKQRLFCSPAHKVAHRDAGGARPAPVPAACARCRKPVPAGRWVYCSTPCSASHRQSRAISRARAAGGDALRLVRAMREETPAGLCLYCERPLPPRHRMTCRDVECLRLYNRDFQNARRNPPEALHGDA
jgi:hypothetical protein